MFKPAVGDAVVELLRPIREEAGRLMADKAYLEISAQLYNRTNGRRRFCGGRIRLYRSMITPSPFSRRMSTR